MKDVMKMLFGGDFQSQVYDKGGMLNPHERYVLEIEGLTGVRKEAIESYITENKLSDNDVLNIVIGLGRKQLKGSDVSNAVVGVKGNNYSKKIIAFAKDNKGMKMANGGDFQSGVYAKGGSLEAHGIEIGDTFIKTISGGIHKVKDKNGKIVYIDLSNGERDTQPPLPFENGGGLQDEFYIKYLNKDKNFKEDIKYFKSYDDAQKWGRENLENFNSDMINFKFENGGNIGIEDGIEEDINMTDDKVLRVRKPAMPEKKLSNLELAEKHNSGAYEFMGQDKMMAGGNVSNFKIGDEVTIIKPFPNGDMTGKKGKIVELSVNNTGVIYILVDGKRIAVLSEYISKNKMATGGALVGNQSRIDMNHNGKIDAEDFKLLRSSMNGAWRNERKHVNHSEDYEVRYAKPRPNRTGYKGKRKFGEGGGISNFERLSRVVAKNYEGKRVKPAYQKEYGKVYSKSEAKEVGNKVAGKMKIMKKAESGTMVKKGNRGGIMSLAKQIRKEGESWQDALKRAGQQLK